MIAGVHGCGCAPAHGRRAPLAAQPGSQGAARPGPRRASTERDGLRRPDAVRGPGENGKNLNRSFPGDPTGTLAEPRLAYDAFNQLIRGSDAYVDAHCGDLVEALQPFALYEAGPAEHRARELAAAYGLPYVIRRAGRAGRTVNGTSSASAAGLGIPAITAEAGGCGLVRSAPSPCTWPG